jgi:hypothetical protein
MMREGVWTFRDGCEHSSSLRIYRWHDPVTPFKAGMYFRGAAIKAALSVRTIHFMVSYVFGLLHPRFFYANWGIVTFRMNTQRVVPVPL